MTESYSFEVRPIGSVLGLHQSRSEVGTVVLLRRRSNNLALSLSLAVAVLRYMAVYIDARKGRDHM